MLEDFGQKVDVTRRIREVLLNYPEGTTILKELIQNADDANATKLSLCLDRRCHGTSSLLSPKLGQWQGPALLAYNDAVFTDDDFVSISRIGASTKHGQTTKTGRFGVGFNSVYHLTDLPSFVSGKYVVLFDPQGLYLPNVSTANPGKRIEYVASSALSFYEDQFRPYCSFGCDMKAPFHGTLFRFPLRNADQAANSKLSKQAYVEEDISSMFAQLYDEGVFSLLFLKSVLSVEMYIWDAGFPQPRKVYSCCINLADEETVWHRHALVRLSKSTNISDMVTDTFCLNFVTEAVLQSGSQKKMDTYYIAQTMASPTSRIGSFAATAFKDYNIHLLPWASVAACISDNSNNECNHKPGRAFCFLPLPIQTGMAVQINGYFEVSSNRRGIWYGGDMDRSGRIRSLWNKILLEDVVTPTFTRVLLGVQKLIGPSDFYYSLFPSGSFEEPWNILVENIYRNVSSAPVLYSEIEGGRWASPEDSFLHDEEFCKSKELREALVDLGMPVVHLPKVLLDMLLKFSGHSKQKVVTPGSVRHYLRKCKSLSELRRLYKLILLEYCLEDLLDNDVGGHVHNLPLLPLASGEFGILMEASKGVSYFVYHELEYSLLQQISDRIIDHDVPPNLYERLSTIAKASTTNLFVFNMHFLLQFFPIFVPPEWKYKSKVFWDPNSTSAHPDSSWFMLFWQYLRDNCDKLSLFGDWPILPSLSRHLHRPCLQSKLLNVDKLSKKMQDILVQIGCEILDNSYGVDHTELPKYVSDADADAAGVLESIFGAVSSDSSIRQIFQGFNADEKDELRQFFLDPKWYIGDRMSNSDLLDCKRLPIYRVHNGDFPQSIEYSDLGNPRKYFPPLDIPECFLCAEFISISSSKEEEVLSRYFGVERMRKAKFYKLHVLNRVSVLQPEVRDSIMISVLRELPQLCADDTSLKECLKTLEFIPTLSGSLKAPAALHDPRNEELYALLDDSDSFPAGAFQESNILDMLQSLGLRLNVSLETILQSARQIESLIREDQDRAYMKGKVLLSYLEVNASKWLPDEEQGTVNKLLSRATTPFRQRNVKSDIEKFWNDLRMICWCPVLVSPPYQALPWPTVSSKVAPPKLVRMNIDMWLVSASMRILDRECSSTALSHQLGWSSAPGGSVIAAQLLELGKDNEFVTNQVLRQELALAMPRIYAILMGMVGTDEMDIVKAVLEGSRWIWVGDGFATSEEVVLNGPLHLAPYIRVIPVDLAVFSYLFLELGIREFLKTSDYANILCRMAARKGSVPLEGQEIRAALLIAQHLAESQFGEQQIKIYLPDTSGRLIAATDLVYNDAPWLLGSDDSHNSFENVSTMAFAAKKTVQKFVHGNISNDVAEKLGVCSLRRMLLAESADSMNLSLSGAAEAFGQHEALTTRLRHILEMYADGPGILFELVQNAEDAKASEVIFLLDKTQHGTSSVLSPDMADWQGPALYSFNDSVFSPQDLYAISRIGQESKLDKPFAIGRFGLGFNSVYHFTDIPTFVSGENVVMFDPHASYLPGISPSHPGLRIKFVGREILEQFPDQFSPYLHFGCDLQRPFPGTLFRFPLRSGNVASRSQIKKESYAPEDVISLFSSFSEVVAETLVFLRNVKSISVFVKEGAGSEMQLLHRVSKEIVTEPDAADSKFHHLFSSMHGNQQDAVDKDHFLNKLRKSLDTTLPWSCQKVLVSEQNLRGYNSHVWITSECLGLNKSASLDKKWQKFTPWACIASYLHSGKVGQEVNDYEDGQRSYIPDPDTSQYSIASVQNRKSEGRAFCFLPLPVFTGLPAHVNAYFELSSNRRDIWFGNDMAGGGKQRSEWNMYLLEDVAAPAYAHLLQRVAPEIGPCELFFSLWPTAVGLEPWASMVRKLYLFIAEFGVPVLYTKARGGQWISTKQAIFPDYNFHMAQELVESLSHAGLAVVTFPKAVVEKFRECCPQLHFLTPQLLRSLLIRRKRGFKDRSSMMLILEYCLMDLTDPIQFDSLQGVPLIPLSNGTFTTFEKKGMGEKIFVARGCEYGLLKDFVPYQLVDSEISDMLHEKFCDLARSEDLNVCLLTCDLLENLFTRILPPEWQHAKLVSWAPGLQGHPSLGWMRLLWDFLKLSCDDLSVFSKWPILPVGNHYLLQLVENSNVIEDDGWSENMSSLLMKVGCPILRSDVAAEHAQLKKFVQPPTAVGLLNALLTAAGRIEDVEGLFTDASEGELRELRSFILQSKWFSEHSLDCMHINIIKELPVFETCRTRKRVGLSKHAKWLKPNNVREELLDDNFVRTESDKEVIILRNFLGVSEPSGAEFYKDFLHNRMPEFVAHEEALLAILRDVKLLTEDDSDLKTTLSNTPFVLAGNGSWKEPWRLYDPRVPELQKLLYQGVFFPSENFSDPATLDSLVELGLRQNLGFAGLLDCARSLSMLHEVNDSRTTDYGKMLLFCLDAIALKLSTQDDQGKNNDFVKVTEDQISSDAEDEADYCINRDESYFRDALDIDTLIKNLDGDMPGEEFWTELKTIAWCPVYSDSPLQGLPWSVPRDPIAAPVDVRPKSQMWIVSSKLNILACDCHSTYLQGKLGWMDLPSVDVLSAQLICISQTYSQLKLHSTIDPDFDAGIKKELPLLYSKLQEYISTDELTVLKSALNGVSWVWIGDDFVPTDALAFDSPVKFSPYLYVVPSELSDFKDLLLALGVRLSFDVIDYMLLLHRLQKDVKGSQLSSDQLSFVNCVLEALSECYFDQELSDTSNTALLIPDSYGRLTSAVDLVYNDAVWLDNTLVGKLLVHPSISNDLAKSLGVQSLRCLSLVGEEMTKDLPCMDYSRICELLSLYGNKEFLLFDLLELADCCKAKKLHLVIDKSEHPRQTLLQQNLGEFQGPALLAVLDGVSLTREELSNFQYLSPWRLRGDTLNYGLGLLSCFSVCDILSVVSGGFLYMFDPRGLAFALPSSCAPAAKMFSMTGTNLIEQFHDQFVPLMVGQSTPWSMSDSTIIRMPLSSEFSKNGLECGFKRLEQTFERLMECGSRLLLFLKSVEQVTLSKLEEGSIQIHQDFAVSVESSQSGLRNPFSEKKWRKFQISRLFSSSNAATKLHLIDVNLRQGERRVVDKWLIVLSLGSGQTRNMALDRRYLTYNLTPIAGVAAHISRDGQPAEVHRSSSVMCPLPLSGSMNIPVTVLGCFLPRHNQGRYLFKYQIEELAEAQSDPGNQLIEAWNRELMACVRDSYIEMALEMQKLRKDQSSSTQESNLCRAVCVAMMAYGDRYFFWPRSKGNGQINLEDGCTLEQSKLLKVDWECVIDNVIKPFYSRLVDLPVWQLYSGNIVKAEEGMFLSQPGIKVGGSVLPATVCAFVKEHYPVFSVPWELVAEIKSVGFMVREIKPKMVRDLLKASSTSIVLKSVDTYVDVLEYCLSDIFNYHPLKLQMVDMLSEPSNSEPVCGIRGKEASTSHYLPNQELDQPYGVHNQKVAGSSGDAVDVMTSLGKALFDFGRGVVEDFGRGGGSVGQNSTSAGSTSDIVSRNVDQKFLRVAAELKGLPFPTATNHLVKLGHTEVWVANKEQQELMTTVAAKFIHLKVLDRSILANIFSDCILQTLLKLQTFSIQLLVNHLPQLFDKNWVNYVMSSNMVPWFSWESSISSGGEGGPSADWIRLFWKCFNGSLEDLPLLSEWPLIPAFLGRSVLCRVRERHLVFIPPPITDPQSVNVDIETTISERNLTELPSEIEFIQPYVAGFQLSRSRFPWLLLLLSQCNIPIFDDAFMDCAASCVCLPTPGQLLGDVIVSKLVAAKQAGYFSELTSFSPPDCDDLLTLLASNLSNGSNYSSEAIEVLRDLPIFKTVTGSYTRLQNQYMCLISSNSFFKPYDEHCLSYSADSSESALLQSLRVPVLHDKQIFTRFRLPRFESKSVPEQEDILIYLYANWPDLQLDSVVIEALRESKFVRNADESSMVLSKPKDLFDPDDNLLMSVFSGERTKFPGERFSTDGWLRILKKIGLRTAVEPDMILECARRIEFLGGESTKTRGVSDDFETDQFDSMDEVPLELWFLAESVLKTIFSNFAVLYSNNFCNTLSKIACVPAEKGFPSLGGKKGGKRVLCSYDEAILLKDWPLAWSSAPILSRQSVVPPDYSWGALHLTSPPAFSTVLRHLQVIGSNNGEDTLAHWPTTSVPMTVEKASLEILKYIDKVWGTLSPADKNEMQKVAFMPAANGTRLVKASSLFARLTINLSPFSFELPSLYLPFVKVLKEMGLQDMLSVACAQDILSNLQRACGYQRLNPNELRAVLEILHFISDKNVGENKSDKSNWPFEAIVPDLGNKLVHARSCVYVDSYGSRFVEHIDISRLQLVSPDLPERLCTALEIKKLSDVVIEQLDEAEPPHTVDQIGFLPLITIKQKLLSKSFQLAVWDIINSICNDIQILDSVSAESIEAQFIFVAERLQFVRCIYSRFLLLPDSVDITLTGKESVIPEWENEFRHRTLYFVGRGRMLVAEPPSCIPFLDVISLIVSHVLRCPIPLPVGSLLLCPQGSEGAIVNLLKLRSKKRATDSQGSKNSLIGRSILPQDALQVQLHPLRPFYLGEIVAWRSQNGEKMKYGRVVADVRPSAGQALYRFNVEISPGVCESLLSSHVFSFKGVSVSNEASSGSIPESHLMTESRVIIEEPESSRTCQKRFIQPHKEQHYGRVSAAELVQAVHEMLSAAGINIDVEKRSLLQTTVTLQEQLKESQAILLLEQEKCDMATKEAEVAKAAWVCRVCLTNEVEISIVPCGHVLCRRCSLAVSKCPFCRLQVSKAMRIFRP